MKYLFLILNFLINLTAYATINGRIELEDKAKIWCQGLDSSHYVHSLPAHSLRDLSFVRFCSLHASKVHIGEHAHYEFSSNSEDQK